MNSTEEQIVALQPLQSGRCQNNTVLGQLWNMKFYIFNCFSMVIVLFFLTHRDFNRGIAIGMGLTLAACFLGTAQNRARRPMENQRLKPVSHTKDWPDWVCCLLLWIALSLTVWIALT